MTLDHLVREPAKPAGALILNHGRGTDERDLYDLIDVLDPERRLVGITPGAPLTNIPPGGRHWYVVPRVGYPDPETFHASYRLLSEFLDETLAARGLSWDRALLGEVLDGCRDVVRGRPRRGATVAGRDPRDERVHPDRRRMERRPRRAAGSRS